jgi:hypothetical protein
VKDYLAALDGPNGGDEIRKGDYAIASDGGRWKAERNRIEL